MSVSSAGPKGAHDAAAARTARLLESWRRRRGAGPDEPVFATMTGTRLSSDVVEDLLAKHLAVALSAVRRFGTSKSRPTRCVIPAP